MTERDLTKIDLWYTMDARKPNDFLIKDVDSILNEEYYFVLMITGEYTRTFSNGTYISSPSVYITKNKEIAEKIYNGDKYYKLEDSLKKGIELINSNKLDNHSFIIYYNDRDNTSNSIRYKRIDLLRKASRNSYRGTLNSICDTRYVGKMKLREMFEILTWEEEKKELNF